MKIKPEREQRILQQDGATYSASSATAMNMCVCGLQTDSWFKYSDGHLVLCVPVMTDCCNCERLLYFVLNMVLSSLLVGGTVL